MLRKLLRKLTYLQVSIIENLSKRNRAHFKLTVGSVKNGICMFL